MKNKNFFLFGMIGGFILGIISGIFFPNFALNFNVIGTLFLNALKMVVLPLIIVAIINSILRIGNLNVFGRLGMKTMLYYFTTTAISVAIGIIIALIFKPGNGVETILGKIPSVIQGKEKISIVDMLLTLVPGNIFKSLVEFKVLPIILVSIIFGVSFLIISEGKGILPDLFDQLEKSVMLVVNWVMFFTPIGIFAIVGGKIASVEGSFIKILFGISKYIAVLLGALGIHSLVILTFIYFIFLRKNPFLYINQVKEALLMAFATASSAVTLPLTRKCVIEKGKASSKTADFILPLGATVNMDGTALYEGVAVVFICQAYGIQLGIIECLTIFITAILAGVGAAAIPQAGLVTMVVVLKSVGAPIEGIGLLLSVDWLMDRFRTAVNVWGDIVGVAVIDKIDFNKNK